MKIIKSEDSNNSHDMETSVTLRDPESESDYTKSPEELKQLILRGETDELVEYINQCWEQKTGLEVKIALGEPDQELFKESNLKFIFSYTQKIGKLSILELLGILGYADSFVKIGRNFGHLMLSAAAQHILKIIKLFTKELQSNDSHLLDKYSDIIGFVITCNGFILENFSEAIEAINLLPNHNIWGIGIFGDLLINGNIVLFPPDAYKKFYEYSKAKGIILPDSEETSVMLVYERDNRTIRLEPHSRVEYFAEFVKATFFGCDPQSSPRRPLTVLSTYRKDKATGELIEEMNKLEIDYDSRDYIKNIAIDGMFKLGEIRAIATRNIALAEARLSELAKIESNKQCPKSIEQERADLKEEIEINEKYLQIPKSLGIAYNQYIKKLRKIHELGRLKGCNFPKFIPTNKEVLFELFKQAIEDAESIIGHNPNILSDGKAVNICDNNPATNMSTVNAAIINGARVPSANPYSNNDAIRL